MGRAAVDEWKPGRVSIGAMDLNFGDLKTAIIGVIGGFIVLGIQRYWLNQSVKSLKRRIEETETYKANVNNLAKSDRALLIMAFQAVFLMVAVICCIVIIQLLFLFGKQEFPFALICVLLWSLPVLVCFAVVKTLRDVHDYPQSLTTIEEKITKLKNKYLTKNKS